MNTRTSITVDSRKLADWRVLKAEVERQQAATLSWTQFLDHVIGEYRANSDDLVAVMGQDNTPLSEDDLEAMGVEWLPGLPLTISEEDANRIAEMVVSKLHIDHENQ